MTHLLTIHSIATTARRALALMSMVVGLLACGSFEVPDYNNESLQGLVSNPTPSGVATVAQGLQASARNVAANYAQHLGIMGREAYNLSVANGTAPTYLIGPLTTGVFFVISTWNGPYAGIRDANILLHALDVVNGLTDAQKEATRGFAKTMQAYFLLHLAATRDTAGIPLDVDRPVPDLAPVATRAEAYTRIDALLDQAKTHLQTGGSSFPFSLTPGFTGFNTPVTFLKFNRALKARADVYNNNWAGALAALAESFVDTTASLALGVYHTFTTNSGDATNPLFNASFYWAHPSIQSQAQTRPDASLDLRAQAKVVVGAPGTLIGVTSNLKFTNPSGPASPLAAIRNEELILLRAEANIGINTPASLSDAIKDINVVRVKSGGLSSISDPYVPAAGQPPTLLDELLYEKRYSLWWEGGHRWLDARHYGKLAQLPRDLAPHRLFEILPYSAGECFQREQQAKGCVTVAGL